jgi:hypothetical protein
MWTLLGLFFWGLLQIGLTIRGDQYLSMRLITSCKLHSVLSS